jgi:hypothetical protein
VGGVVVCAVTESVVTRTDHIEALLAEALADVPFVVRG